MVTLVCTTKLMTTIAKVGRFASEEVTLELIIKKCVPILTYGLEVCPLLPRRVLHSLDFTINGLSLIHI